MSRRHLPCLLLLASMGCTTPTPPTPNPDGRVLVNRETARTSRPPNAEIAARGARFASRHAVTFAFYPDQLSKLESLNSHWYEHWAWLRNQLMQERQLPPFWKALLEVNDLLDPKRPVMLGLLATEDLEGALGAGWGAPLDRLEEPVELCFSMELPTSEHQKVERVAIKLMNVLIPTRVSPHIKLPGAKVHEGVKGGEGVVFSVRPADAKTTRADMCVVTGAYDVGGSPVYKSTLQAVFERGLQEAQDPALDPAKNPAMSHFLEGDGAVSMFINARLSLGLWNAFNGDRYVSFGSWRDMKRALLRDWQSQGVLGQMLQERLDGSGDKTASLTLGKTISMRVTENQPIEEWPLVQASYADAAPVPKVIPEATMSLHMVGSWSPLTKASQPSYMKMNPGERLSRVIDDDGLEFLVFFLDEPEQVLGWIRSEFQKGRKWSVGDDLLPSSASLALDFRFFTDRYGQAPGISIFGAFDPKHKASAIGTYLDLFKRLGIFDQGRRRRGEEAPEVVQMRTLEGPPPTVRADTSLTRPLHVEALHELPPGLHGHMNFEHFIPMARRDLEAIVLMRLLSTVRASVQHRPGYRASIFESNPAFASQPLTYPTPVLLSDKIRVPPRARTSAGQACLLRAFERRFAARRRLRDVKPEEVEAWIGRYLLDETTSMRSLWTCASKDKSLAAHARQLEARWYFHAAWLYGLMRQKKEAESWAAKGCALLPRPWCANGLPKNSYFRFDAKDVIKP